LFCKITDQHKKYIVRRFLNQIMSELYLTDCYLKEFEATVESVKDDKFVTLEKTAFYPKEGRTTLNIMNMELDR